MKSLPAFCTSLLLLFGIAQAVGQTFRFDHLNIQDGLSQSQAYTIFQDSYGYIWIGTQDGLNRYDGNEFKVFKNDPFDSTTLTHNWIWSIQEDNHGDLWLGTYQGLCKYDRKRNKFVQYFHSPKDSTSIGGNRTNNVVKDKKGRLWISSWGNGLSLYDEATNTFTRFKSELENSRSISDNFIRSLFCDRNGVLWIGTWSGGLNRMVEDESGIHFQRISPEEKLFGSINKITSITEDRGGNLWICRDDLGLAVFNVSANNFIQIAGFSQKYANKAICDREGNMWIGTNSGLDFYDHVTKTFHHYHHDPTNLSGLSSNTVYALMEDNTGIVWIAGNGLDRYDPRKNSFETYQHNPADPRSLSNNMTWSFCEDDEGNIWIGSESNHVNVFNPRTKEFRQIIVHDDKGNSARQIYKMIYRNGVFWIASFGTGLIRYEKKTGKTKFYLGTPGSPFEKISLVTELMLDDDSSLWVGTEGDGLFHLNPETEAVVQYKADINSPQGIGSNQIKSIHKDSKGNVWLCYTGDGVGMLDRKTKKFKQYRYDRKNVDGLSDQIVISITQQNDSVFWFCSHGGLNRLNVNTGKFTHFLEKDGLVNNVIYEMLEDAKGNFWISSNGGISQFNPSTNAFKTYTIEDGLQSNEFNSGASLKSSTGDFYFGGVNGFNVFSPDRITEIKTPLPLLIQGYSIFDKSFLPEQNIKLRYFQNYITFSFAALEFSAPDKVKYAYKLEGIDGDWVHSGNRREAHYTNLDAGDYTFLVKASNPDGYWTTNGPSMAITIRPPFWRTWWFTSLAIALALALIYLVHRYQLEQSLKVERLRNKIASDLHDEVGSSLSRISIYSDLLQTGTQMQERKHYLTGIGELSREVVSTMSDIVWSIDNRNDTLGSLIIRMKDFATEILQAKNIELTFSTAGLNENRTLSPALKQNIYLIFKESIHNVVKHAQASHVIVTLVNQTGEFSMIIKDDGHGFKETEKSKSKGNGLRNMKRRAEAVQGEFNIESIAGTTLILKRRSL